MFESEVITTLGIKGVKRHLHKRFDLPFRFHTYKNTHSVMAGSGWNPHTTCEWEVF